MACPITGITEHIGGSASDRGWSTAGQLEELREVSGRLEPRGGGGAAGLERPVRRAMRRAVAVAGCCGAWLLLLLLRRWRRLLRRRCRAPAPEVRVDQLHAGPLSRDAAGPRESQR